MTEETNEQEKPIDDQTRNPNEQGTPSPAEPGPLTADVTALQAKLDETQKSADAFRDQLLRKAAEFENFKRRNEAEFANLIRSANENLVTALLPILDDFHRSLKAGKDVRDYDALYRGIELIASKLSRTLENEGLKAFDSAGKPFDVNYHDALLQIPRDDIPHHTVIEEVERGYMFNDRVLRHAKVIVSSAPEIPPPPPDETTN
jgi:molecular chaperone GrpE